MTIIAILEALTLLAIVHLLMRHHSTAEKAWTEERRELLSRSVADQRKHDDAQEALHTAWAQERRDLLQRQHESEQAWAEERRELLNRVQAPHFTPLPTPEGFVFPEPEPDEINLVGTIADPPD